MQAVADRLGDVDTETVERVERENFDEGDAEVEREGGPTVAVPLMFAEAVGSIEVDGEDVDVFERSAENDMDKDLKDELVEDGEPVEVGENTFDLDSRAEAEKLVETETDFDTPGDADVEGDALTDFDADDDPVVVFVSLAEADFKDEPEAEMVLSGDRLTDVLPVAVLLIETVLEDVVDAVIVRVAPADFVDVCVGADVQEIAAERVADFVLVEEGDTAALNVLVFVFVDVCV